MTVALALTVSACGDDDGGPQVELSQQEVGQLFAAISAVFANFADFSLASPTASFSLMGIADDINQTVSCPQGGSASITGTDNSTATTFDFDVDIGFTSCRSQGFVIGGGLNFDGSGTATETTVSIDLTIAGTLNVETQDGRSGSCTMNLEYSIDVSETSYSFTVSGSICGQTFSQSV